MLLSIEGENCVGKTTLAYSAPLHIVGFNFDLGIQRALYGGKFTELFDGLDIKIVPYDEAGLKHPLTEAQITVFELPRPIQLDTRTMKGCLDLWSYFIKRLSDALSDRAVASIVVDTMTKARRVKADAKLEAAQADGSDRVQLQQIEYGSVNDAIRSIYSTCEAVRKNLIATHHLTDEYEKQRNSEGKMENVLTGERILEGLANTHNAVDIALRMKRDGNGLIGEFLKFGYDLPLIGTSLTNPTWDKLADAIELPTGGRIGIDRRNSNGK